MARRREAARRLIVFVSRALTIGLLELKTRKRKIVDSALMANPREPVVINLGGQLCGRIGYVSLNDVC